MMRRIEFYKGTTFIAQLPIDVEGRLPPLIIVMTVDREPTHFLLDPDTDTTKPGGIARAEGHPPVIPCYRWVDAHPMEVVW